MAEKRIVIKVRLSPEQLSRLNEKVQRVGISREKYLRLLIEGYEPKATPPLNYYSLMQQMRYVGLRLREVAEEAKRNQLVDAVKYEDAMRHFDAVVDEIKQAVTEPEKAK